MNKKVIIIVGILVGLATVAIGVFAFVFGENVAINTNKTTINGEVKMTIGSLKGEQEVESFEINEATNGTVSIPYKASVGEGELVLEVERSDETVWEEKLSSNNSGVIEFEGTKGTYHITLHTEEAKDITLNVSLY